MSVLLSRYHGRMKKILNLVVTDMAISSLSKSLQSFTSYRKQQFDQPKGDLRIDVPGSSCFSTKAGNEWEPKNKRLFRKSPKSEYFW